MREAFVGFDSAWADRDPGGITYATFEDGRPHSFVDPELVHFKDAAQIIERLRDTCAYVLVSIDQPTLVPNEEGMRPVEKVAASLIGSLGSGVQPAFRGGKKAAMFGPSAPIWEFLRRIGARENPPAARDATQGLHLLEVFPRPCVAGAGTRLSDARVDGALQPRPQLHAVRLEVGRIDRAAPRRCALPAATVTMVGRDGKARHAEEERPRQAGCGSLSGHRLVLAASTARPVYRDRRF